MSKKKKTSNNPPYSDMKPKHDLSASLAIPWSFLVMSPNWHLAEHKIRVRFPARCKPVRGLSISRWKTFVSLLSIWSSVAEWLKWQAFYQALKFWRKLLSFCTARAKAIPGIVVCWEFLSGGNQSELVFVAALKPDCYKFQKSFERRLLRLSASRWNPSSSVVKDIQCRYSCFISLSDPLAVSMSGHNK